MFLKNLKNLFKKKIIFFLIMDTALIMLAMFLSFLLRFDNNIPAHYLPNFWIFIGLALIINLPIFIWRGLYSLSWSYVSVKELISIIKAITIGSAFLGAALFILRDHGPFQGFPRSIVFINYFLCLLFITGLRASKRIVYEANHKERMIDNIRAQDLIKRDEVPADKNLIKNFLQDRIVLVTGAAGSIGSELVNQIKQFSPRKLIALDQDETGLFNLSHDCSVIASVRDFEKLEKVFLKYKPKIIFHAAAYKHVPLMEQNPDEAEKTNIHGTQNLVNLAKKYNIQKFVLVSTDKAVNPSSVMGRTKREAEKIVIGNNYCAVRFGNVLGSRGSVVPIFRKQIQEGGPITVTHPDMTRYFMTTDEAVSLIIQAGAIAHGGEIFVLDMGEPIKITDLAKKMIKMAGLRPDKDIKIVYTGIRPGEKLHEDIFSDKENMLKTKHRKIFKLNA
ncbi:MAG: nucleoside-diphosphate sugar epimerase/dehydratase [bacterium]